MGIFIIVAVFLFSVLLIVSQVTVTTTTPTVMVLCSGSLTINETVTMAPTSVGLAAALGQHCATEATSVPDAFSGLCLLCHGSSSGNFFFRVDLPPDFCMLVSVMVFAFSSRFQCGCHVYQWGFSCWHLDHCNPLEFMHGRPMCLLVMVHCSCQVCTE